MCIRCEGSELMLVEFAILLAAIGVLPPVLYSVYKRARWGWKYRCMNVLKIMITYFQILNVTRIPNLFVWPRLFKQLLDALSALGLDINFASLQCAASLNHYERLLVTTLSPIIFIAVSALVVKLGKATLKRLGKDQEHYHSKRITTTIVCATLLFTYAPISKTITQTFDCMSIAGAHYLRADISLQCNTPTYWGFATYAMIATLTYSIGTPIRNLLVSCLELLADTKVYHTNRSLAL